MDIVEDRAATARAIFAGLCVSLVGIGLARFAYTPLIPPMIEAHWFVASDVVYLGAANLSDTWWVHCWDGRCRAAMAPGPPCGR